MRRLRNHDEGFTLVEVVLAMVIIAGIMATLAGVLASSLGTIAQARQRQTATALATQALERLRALPYNTVTLGVTGATPDAAAVYAVDVSGVYRLQTSLPGLSLDEELVINDVSGRVQDLTVDEVTYHVHTYVSKAPLTAGNQQAFNFTALVAYTSGVSRGERITAQRSVGYSPTGCLSTAQNPFAAPCQDYFTGNAGRVLSGFTITNPDNGALPIPGFDAGGATQLDLSFASNTATLLIEQTASASAQAVTSASRVAGPVMTSVGSVAASATVDSDPSSAPNQADAQTVIQSGGTRSVAGSAGELSATTTPSDTGRAAAAIFADASHCVGANGIGLATGPTGRLRPCGSSNVQGAGSAGSIVYRPGLSYGWASMSIPVIDVAPDPAQSRAVAAQLPSCILGTTTGNGCSHAAATRSTGALTVAQPTAGAVVPPDFDPALGLVSLTGITEEAEAQEGVGAGTPTYTRSGLLRVYLGPGLGYATASLADYQTAGGTSGYWPIAETVIDYVPPSGGQVVTITYSGHVSVLAPQVTRTPAVRSGDPTVDCKTEACVTSVTAGGVVVSVTAIISVSGTEIGRYGLAGSMGGLVSEATFKAAASAT